MIGRLPRFARIVLRAVLPADRADAILADLELDYARVSGQRGATVWLAREVLSLWRAYAGEPFWRFRRALPMWVRDLQLVARDVRRGPVAAAGAVAMLSVGLVAVLITAGLSSALLFRPVSDAHGPALRRVAGVDRQGRLATRVSYPELQVIREHAGSAGTFAAVYLQPVVLRADGADVQTMAEVVDGPYFALMGTRVLLGRGLLAADEQPSTAPPAVLSESFWRRVFGGSPDVLGRPILLNRAAFTVIGVAGAAGSASSVGATVDAWVPMAHADPVMDKGWREDPTKRWYSAFVLPMSIAELDLRLAGANADLARRFPDPWRDRTLQTIDGTALIGSQRIAALRLSAVLAGLSALILATAASNIGGVLLARAAASRRQTAIMLSLGSGRGGVIRRQLVEGSALGAAGGLLATALYAWARTWFTEISVLPTLALRLELPLTPMLVAGVVGLGGLAGLLLAIGPAVWASRPDAARLIGDSDSRGGASPRITRVRSVLVSAQVGLTVTLIVGAALFARSIAALRSVDLGFQRSGLVAMDFDVEPSGPEAMNLPLLARQALAAAESVPGVASAAMSNRAPVDTSTPSVDVHPANPDRTIRDVTYYLAAGRYFETVGLRLIAGRAFTEAESAAQAPLAIVNEVLAARLWPGADALDRALHLDDGTVLRVVGIARASKYRALDEAPRPHLYRPSPPGLGMTLLARTDGNPRAALAAVQAALDTVGPGLVGFFPRTMDDHLAIQLLPPRTAARAAAGLGLLALVLSGVGLYGLVSWIVELRRPEIGVRMALGASAGDVSRMIVRSGMAAAVPGLVAGIAAAIALGLLARSALFGVGPVDLLALAIGIAAVVAVVVAASLVPSRRAARIDPAIAFRQ